MLSNAVATCTNETHVRKQKTIESMNLRISVPSSSSRFKVQGSVRRLKPARCCE
jgi:hypothetical protein